MRAFPVLLVFLLALSGLPAAPARAQSIPEENPRERTLRFECRATVAGGTASGDDSESAIVSTSPATGARLGARQVAFDRKRPGQRIEQMDVGAGELAECRFPSGRRIRVKVGEDSDGGGLGMCGADYPVFMSVWIDGRKVESRRWFAGHCYRDEPGNPDLRLQFLFARARTLAQRCETRAGDAGKPTTTTCTAYPDLAHLPVDVREYPPAGMHFPKTGEVELLAGSDPVCAPVRAMLQQDFRMLERELPPQAGVRFPDWSDALEQEDAALSAVDGFKQAAVFDLDNDGKPERVMRMTFSSHYMTGDILMTRYGSTAALLWDGKADDRGLAMLPCQIGDPHAAAHRCVPFSQGHDQVDAFLRFSTGPDRLPVVLDSRYLNFTPFFFAKRTYIAVGGIGAPEHVAVVEPQPGGAWRQSCLFHQVRENF